MRAEGFTRWDAFLQLNFHPRKQVNPLMTQEQEQQKNCCSLSVLYEFLCRIVPTDVDFFQGMTAQKFVQN